MFTLGYAVNFDSLQDYTNAKLMRYPCYPWDEHHLWPKDEYATQEHTMLLLGAPISINKDECIWENEIDLLRFPYIHDHQTNSIGKQNVYTSLFINIILTNISVYDLLRK